MPATLNLYLIRHGQTEYNAAGIVQGWCDSPLTAEGKAGAAQTGNAIAQAQIPFAAAYCSTSPRTAATVQIILQHARQPHITPVALDDLREYHFGSFEQQPSRHIHQTIAQELGYDSTEDWLADYRSGKHSNNQLMHTLHRIDPAAEQESQFIRRLHRGIQHIIANSLADINQGSLKTGVQSFIFCCNSSNIILNVASSLSFWANSSSLCWITSFSFSISAFNISADELL